MQFSFHVYKALHLTYSQKITTLARLYSQRVFLCSCATNSHTKGTFRFRRPFHHIHFRQDNGISSAAHTNILVCHTSATWQMRILVLFKLSAVRFGCLYNIGNFPYCEFAALCELNERTQGCHVVMCPSVGMFQFKNRCGTDIRHWRPPLSRTCNFLQQ